ncbi:MAG TPA: cytochrome c, partial [Alphaproteobacteria bacterium]|nr:cytochrome c [Alphaproteobacteria bacterium]
MVESKGWVVVFVLLAVGISLARGANRSAETTSPRGPDLGHRVSDKTAAAWDISIPPDGHNLPPGSGTVADGEKLYRERCIDCHGKEGQGLSAEELVGGVGGLAGDYPEKTVGSYWPYATTLFDYIRRAMPQEAPLSLSPDEVYALCAYLLFLNGVIAEADEIN